MAARAFATCLRPTTDGKWEAVLWHGVRGNGSAILSPEIICQDRERDWVRDLLYQYVLNPDPKIGVDPDSWAQFHPQHVKYTDLRNLLSTTLSQYDRANGFKNDKGIHLIFEFDDATPDPITWYAQWHKASSALDITFRTQTRPEVDLLDLARQICHP